MAVPNSKLELQQAIRSNYEKLKKDLIDIPLEKVEQQSMQGHAKDTLMSVNQLLSYLIGWGNLVLKWNEIKDKGSEPDFPETGYKWNELGALAQKFYTDYQDEDFLQLQLHLDATIDKILNLIENKSNTELYEKTWYNQWTLGRMIQFNTSSPYSNARARLRKWKKNSI